jgi:hypothetical protein
LGRRIWSTNCRNNKRVWFLRHRCEDNGSYDYKPTDFCLAVTESDSSFENFVCDITSYKQTETCEFYNMNGKSIIDFTKRYDKSETKLYCTNCDPDFSLHDQYKVNAYDLPLLVVADNDGDNEHLYVEEDI